MKKALFSSFLILTFLQVSFAQTPDSNKQIANRYFDEVINHQKIEKLDELFSKDFVYYDLSNFTITNGLKSLQDILQVFFKAFPDTHDTIENMVAEGDKVFAQITFTATQKADFMGIPASNKKIKITEMYLFTVKDSKITECRRLVDFYSFFKQLSEK